MAEFLAQLVNGLAIGAVYAVVALGFVLVFGVAKVVNFAQGSQVMLGAYLVWVASGWGLPLPLAFLVAVAGSVLLAVLIELICVEWLGESAEIAPLLSTLAIAFIIDQTVRLVWSANPQRFPNPFAGANLRVGPLYVGLTDVIIIATAVVFVALLAVLLKATWLGRSVRAAAQDPVAAQQMGVRTGPAKVTVFALSGVLGALGGVLVGMYFQQIDPTMGLPFGLKGFAAAMVGGVVSLAGAVLGGLLIGVAESLAGGYIGSEYRDLVAFVMLLLVLVLRPQGLLGSRALTGLGGARGAGAIPTTSPLADASGFPVTVMGTRRVPVWWVAVGTLLLGAFATTVASSYWSGVLAQGAIFATAALGLMVLTGMTGYVSVGHGALMGVGAYWTARVVTGLDLPFELVLLSVVLVSVVAGVLFAYPVLGLSGHTIALATLALGQIGYLLFLNLIEVTRGPMGIGGIPPPRFALLGGATDFSIAWMTGVCFVVLLLGLGLVAAVTRGQVSVNLRAIREDRLAAEAFGVHVRPYLTIAFALSSVLAGLAGMMFAYQQSYVSPDSFLILVSFLLLTMILAGGIVSPAGAVVGAFVLVALPELLREQTELREILYGLVLILIIRFMPSGITSLGRRARSSGQDRDGLTTVAEQHAAGDPVSGGARQ